jgi:D-alanyl-lipoteichoic acid acyltransferase DltB (MBOAT superfamily)
MAIGVSRIFNIQLPANFESPYKSRSIKDFWRRWHMTLSRFLRDYLYIPLGGNRASLARRYINLWITMILGGLWHGAGWTFIIWGALHGAYLCVNHAWDAMATRLGTQPVRFAGMRSVLAWAVTFGAVMVAWVFFRAPDVTIALRLLSAMVGLQDNAGPTLLQVAGQGGTPLVVWLGGDIEQMAWLTAGLAIVLLLPNVRQVMARHELVLPSSARAAETFRHVQDLLRWKPSLRWAMATVGLFLVSLSYLGRVSPFLYFQF